MGLVVLGDLVEVWVNSPDDGLVCHHPTGLHLAWDPDTERAHVVRLLQELDGEPDDGDADTLRGFLWDPEADVSRWQVSTPPAKKRENAKKLGSLAAVVYYQTKGGDTSEWEHWFGRDHGYDVPLPHVWRHGPHWWLTGRVVVTDAGIVS